MVLVISHGHGNTPYAGKHWKEIKERYQVKHQSIFVGFINNINGNWCFKSSATLLLYW